MELIEWLQSFHHPFWDWFFKIVTAFGGEFFYLLILPILFWGWRKREGLWLGWVLFVTLYITSLLKALFAIPRPEGVALVSASGCSFPSGHAMGSFAFFISLGWVTARRAVWWVVIPMVFLIGTSRVYLGVHYLSDVIGGWAIAAIILLLLTPIREHFLEALKRGRFAMLGVIATALVGVCFMVHPEPFSPFPIAILGVLSGIFVGASIEWRGDSYRIPKEKEARIYFILPGLIIGIGLFIGLKAILPEAPVFRFLRYFLLALWIGWGAPTCFRLMQERMGFIPGRSQ
jgi:membrane-associated phospholipid phosphatase